MEKKQIFWLAWIIIGVVVAGIAVAQQPTMVGLQGKVTDNVGNPVNSGNLRVTISTSDSCESALVYDYTYNGIINGGLFNILLGNDSFLNMTYNSDYYACTWVNGEILSNAQQINRTKFRGGQGQIEAAQIANGTIGNNWTFANPPSINITSGPIDLRLIKELLETLAHNQGQLITAERNYRETKYDNFSNTNGLGSSSNLVFDSVASEFHIAPTTGGTPIEQTDFTGGSMDTSWTLLGSATFDAANDEVDILGTSSTTTYNGPDAGNGTFVAAYRNIAGITQARIRAFGITVQDNFAGSNNLADGISGTATITSANRYIRIKRAGSYVKTEYSSDGNSWTTFNEVYNNVDYGNIIDVYGDRPTGGAQVVSFYNLTIYGPSTTGQFISSTTTANSTVTGVLLTGEENLAGSGTVTYYVSLDNGANYQQVTKGELTQINNNLGSQVKLRADLTSAGNFTSLSNYVLYYFMW